MKTLTYSTLAASTTPCAQRAKASMWAVPVQGTGVSVPAFQLRSIVGMTNAASTTSANAAKGATRKDATGGEAFEDPV